MPEPTEPHHCDNCDGIDPASCTNAPTRGDLLRDQIETALRRGRCCPGHIPRVAYAVLPVVEAETGALTHLLRRTEDELHEARAELDKAMQGAALAINLAGRQAEKDRNRAEQAEAALQRVRTLALRARHAAVDTWHLDITGTPPTATVPADDILAALDQPEAAP